MLSSDQKFQFVLLAEFLAGVRLDTMVSDIHFTLYLLNINISVYAKIHLNYPTQQSLFFFSKSIGQNGDNSPANLFMKQFHSRV